MNAVALMALACMGFALTGCNSDEPQCVNNTSGQEAKYVANALLLPKIRQDYGLDLNGDGDADNQLGNIVSALSSLMPQMGVDNSVKAGSVVLLFDETGADLTNNDCAQTVVSAGNKPAMPPAFMGSDSFTINSSLGGGTFKGRIKSGVFTSNSPVTTKTPTMLTIQLPLLGGATAINMMLTGARLQFTKSGDNIMKGQLNGAIKNSDVQGTIVPTVATVMTANIAADPMSQGSMDLLHYFDTGGTADPACNGACKNVTDNSCAMANDKKIDPCEVATNALIKNALGPDVQMFDSSGNYHPNADNSNKDSLSLGLAFTAVKASF